VGGWNPACGRQPRVRTRGCQGFCGVLRGLSGYLPLPPRGIDGNPGMDLSLVLSPTWGTRVVEPHLGNQSGGLVGRWVGGWNPACAWQPRVRTRGCLPHAGLPGFPRGASGVVRVPPSRRPGTAGRPPLDGGTPGRMDGGTPAPGRRDARPWTAGRPPLDGGTPAPGRRDARPWTAGRPPLDARPGW
jgi:hypothetical protein